MLTKEKGNFLTDVKGIKKQLKTLLPESPYFNKLKELESDIINDYCTAVVVGEFKHGKSTFINALIGEALLPMDVTPTTAMIHSLFHGESNDFQIVKSDGKVETMSLNHNNLHNFKVDSEFYVEDVKYLKLHRDSEILKNRVVLVDTPGVNDLNAHRAEVTNQFIPRADVILFLIDITAPLKKSEMKFLEETVLKTGTDHILFIANFIDRIEEEEIDDTLDFISRRLSKVDGLEDPKVVPISSLEGLEGKMNNDADLLELSGLLEVESKLNEMIKEGSKQHMKRERYEKRFNDIAEKISQEIDAVKAINAKSLDELKFEEESLENWFANQEETEHQIQQYMIDRESEIKYMVMKSVGAFRESLEENLLNKIEISDGSNIKALVETQLPITIRTEFSRWIERYSDHIYTLLKKLEKTVSNGLSHAFKQTVNVETNQSAALHYDTVVTLASPKAGNPTVRAGLAMGGASAVVLALGGAIIFPVVGMAGMPFLQEKIKEKQWEKVKPEITYNVEKLLDQLFRNFSKEVDDFIVHALLMIKKETVDEFNTMIKHYSRMIEKKITEMKLQVENDLAYTNELNQFLVEINKLNSSSTI